MLSKNVVKDIQSLGLKKHRDDSRRFVAEGPKVVAELVEALPMHVENIYALTGWNAHSRAEVERITEADLQRISFQKTPNQVLAVFRQPETSLPVAADNWVIYLDAVQDPGNFGTIIRTADWFGIKQVVCSVGCADVFSPKAVQSTMASIGRVKVWYDEDERWLSRQSAPIYAASLSGEPLQKTTIYPPGILLIGNEGNGLRPSFSAMACRSIAIEKRGGAESLNAAVAAGILLSHLVG